MDRHELDPVARVVGIGVGEHGHVRQIMFRRGFLAAHRFVFVDRLFQFGQIVQPLLAAFRPEHDLIPAFIEQHREQFRGRAVMRTGRKRFDQVHEFFRFRSPEYFIVERVFQRLIQCAMVFRGISFQKFHPPDPQVPFRQIHDPPERQVVLQDDHAQIAQRVFDLRPGEELDPAVDPVGDLRFQQRLFQRTGHVMRPVEQRHLPVGDLLLVLFFDLGDDPRRFLVRVHGKMEHHRTAVRQRRGQVFSDPVPVFSDQRIRRRQDLRRGTVVLQHHDRLHIREMLVEVQQILDVRAAPGVDRLVRITHDEQVFVIAAQHFHQLILKRVDILEFVDHDIFQPLLPFQPDRLIPCKNIQRKFDQVVVIQRETFFLLIQIAVENDVVGVVRLQIFFMQRVQRHLDQVQVIIRLAEEFLDLDHVPRIGKRLVAQSQAAFLVDDPQHGVDVAVVQHQETFRILHRVAVLLQNGNAEPVEGVDVTRVVVADQIMDPLPHFVGGLVGERDAQDVAGRDAQFVDQEGEPVGQRAGLARSGPGHHADKSFRGRHRQALFFVQLLQWIVFCHFSRLSACNILRFEKIARFPPKFRIPWNFLLFLRSFILKM